MAAITPDIQAALVKYLTSAGMTPSQALQVVSGYTDYDPTYGRMTDAAGNQWQGFLPTGANLGLPAAPQYNLPDSTNPAVGGGFGLQAGNPSAGYFDNNTGTGGVFVPQAPAPTQPKYTSTLQAVPTTGGDPVSNQQTIGNPITQAKPTTIQDPGISSPYVDANGVLHVPYASTTTQSNGTVLSGTDAAHTGAQDVSNPAPGPTEGMSLQDLINRAYRNGGVNPLMWSNPNFKRVLQQSNDIAGIYSLMNPTLSNNDLVNQIPSMWGPGVNSFIRNQGQSDVFKSAMTENPELVNMFTRAMGYGNFGLGATLPSYVQNQLMPQYEANRNEYVQNGKTTLDMLRQVLNGMF